jgi:hypothetical protein
MRRFKGKCAHFVFTKYLIYTVQVPNFALTHMKRITVLCKNLHPIPFEFLCTVYGEIFPNLLFNANYLTAAQT